MTSESYTSCRAALTTAIAKKRHEFDRAALADLSAPEGTKRTATALRGELASLESELEELDAAQRATTAIAVEQSESDLAQRWLEASERTEADLGEMEAAVRDIESVITELGDRLASCFSVNRRWKEALMRLSDPRQRDLLGGLTVLDYGEVIAAVETVVKVRIDGRDALPLTLSTRVTARAASAREVVRARILPPAIASEAPAGPRRGAGKKITAPELVPQAHGGALRTGGTPGNRGGTGRPRKDRGEPTEPVRHDYDPLATTEAV